MSHRLCSIHHVPLVCHRIAGLWLYVCPVPECGYCRAAKRAPRLKKAQPPARYLNLSDRIKQRDQARARREHA